MFSADGPERMQESRAERGRAKLLNDTLRLPRYLELYRIQCIHLETEVHKAHSRW
jgi:hypothetical protein